MFVVGCRSGVERDVVQREMRKQEDQIYALEDYLTEYQQLLCDARSENAALKRQMVKGQFREGSASIVPETEDTLPSPPAVAPTPPASSQEPEPAAPADDVPPLDLSAPEVPPLDASSDHEPEQIAVREVEPASAEFEVEADTVEAENIEAEVIDAPPSAVVLRGEVQTETDDAATEDMGPRVLLNVEPVDVAGHVVEFHGRLSLLVLDPAAREKERQLARWDFKEAELAEMSGESDSGKGFELPLQLPAESPTNRPLELWVRLLPAEGEKLLGRTTMDLSRPGRFATAEVQPAQQPVKKQRPLVQPAAAQLPVAVKPRSAVQVFETNVDQSGWQIAKPGDVANRPASERTASTEWKLAAQPIPENEPAPLAESMPVPARISPLPNTERYRVADAPTWSPDRPGKNALKSPPADHLVPPPDPRWTPTR